MDVGSDYGRAMQPCMPSLLLYYSILFDGGRPTVPNSLRAIKEAVPRILLDIDL